MSDLIDRQAAIDAIDRLDIPEDMCVFEILSHIELEIGNLPSAQPEQNYDEWCTDCKEYDYENSCCPRWTKVIRQTRRELQDEFVMTAVDGTLWVTVDDVQKAGRVIVDGDKSKFCKTFYGDGQVEQKWIPVTERLPDNSRNVLITHKGGVSMAWYNGLYFEKGASTHHRKIQTVTAWCELPEPYQKGDAE